MTTVYLMRHSKPMKHIYLKNSDSLQIQNEKKILTIDGEEIAKKVSELDEFNNIDKVYSSNYIRAIATAKYVAAKNNIEILIDEDLGERKFGILSWDELPDNFERKQLLDEEYKIGDGECQKEVRERMLLALNKVLNDNKDKRILIVTHGTAISYLLKTWCDVKLVNDKINYSFNDKVFFDGHFNHCETFKLEFDDDRLVSIENIKFNLL